MRNIDGDVTEIDCDVILHQVNCKGVIKADSLYMQEVVKGYTP